MTARELNARVGRRLREIREARGWSLEEVAARCYTSNQQISRLETGKREMTLNWLERLCRALECNALDLLAEPASDPLPVLSEYPDLATWEARCNPKPQVLEDTFPPAPPKGFEAAPRLRLKAA